MLPKEIQIDDKDRYGVLLSPDIKLYRNYFDELVKLQGIKVIYYAPRPDKHYTTYAEIASNYQEPDLVGVIFQDHLDQKSAKKMGWNAELQEDAAVIHVPYDLHDIQIGALFVIPSGLDHTKGRLFRVTQLSNAMVYPASIACEIIPEYEDRMPASKMVRSTQDFNLLRQEDEDDSF